MNADPCSGSDLCRTHSGNKKRNERKVLGDEESAKNNTKWPEQVRVLILVFSVGN